MAYHDREPLDKTALYLSYLDLIRLFYLLNIDINYDNRLSIEDLVDLIKKNQDNYYSEQ